MQLSLARAPRPALGSRLEVTQLNPLILSRPEICGIKRCQFNFFLLRPLLPLLLLYEPALLVQLVLPHVGAGDVIHPEGKDDTFLISLLDAALDVHK